MERVSWITWLRGEPPIGVGRFSGYKEIQNPKERYSLIDHAQLVTLLGRRE